MFKNTCLALFATAVLATGNAYAACANLNINSSGAGVTAQSQAVVYGPYNITCAGPQNFTFQDLSATNSNNTIKHIFEKQNGSTWTVVSSSTSTGAASVTKSFFISTNGTYRYRIENAGTSTIANWTMSGRITLFTIPGTF
ncbi:MULTISPECIES: hypothetical protein [Pseudomonas]|uniref:Lipoprotein n=1 Tax=Pseudomonas cichorii TaxID=36746 RepID=A0A3M4VHR2_PSECI|nr:MULTISPECIES: hypothetical protein [Pseudomonas]AHF68455.1 hypothetical protein PCH70_33020 [Pseudomonas cichorii JBC1]QVE15467.1 hypothetical protein KGD89_16375 [Pseudomonas cichorii]RMR51354.1 hypothetical protein ALP84_02610 [Pseudomonas cichorii]SDO16895.1 hypothetical protein SAMN05216599_106136 [Pseudomonas cichorii]GFM76184.1 hypothetical protein PSCICM_20030 [Pseudomonas cichorii]